MTSQDFKRVIQFAENGPKNEVDCTILNGLAISTEKRYATIDVAAAFLVWHCMNLNGNWDSGELEEFRKLYRYRVELLN